MLAAPPLVLPADGPVLLLDIDGVINVFQCSLARETQVAPHLPMLKLLPGLNDWLAQLDHAFYIVWCSHWGALVNIDAAAAWGLTPRPLIAPLPEAAAHPDWKAHAVRRVFADWDGPIAWVEDGFTSQAHTWAAARLRARRPTWLVDVRDTGLTAEVTQLLLEWATMIAQQ